MNRFVLIALCALVAYVAAQGASTNGFTASGSFESDQKTRTSLYEKFVSRADCGCASASNPMGDWEGCSSSSGATGAFVSGQTAAMMASTPSMGAASTEGGVSMAGVTVPDVSVPGVSVPGVSVPGVSVPGVDCVWSYDDEDVSSIMPEIDNVTVPSVVLSTLGGFTVVTDLPSVPSVPNVPSVPALPSTPAMPNVPSVPSVELPSTPRLPLCQPTGATPSMDMMTTEMPEASTMEMAEGSSAAASAATHMPMGMSTMSIETSSGASCTTSSEYASHHGGWFKTDYCFILRIFISWKSELSEEFQESWQEFIDECQETIILNGELTDAQRFSAIIFKLDVYFEENEIVRDQFIGKYIEFEGFSWGLGFFLQSTANDLVDESTSSSVTKEEVITISGGSCPLFKACDSWAGSDSGKMACASAFKSGCLSFLSSSESFEVKYAKLSVFIKTFFAESEYSEYESSFMSETIEGSCQIGSYKEACDRSWRAQNFDLALGGDEDSCPVVQAIETLESNTTIDVSLRAEYKQWRESIQSIITSTTNTNDRVRGFSNVTYQYVLLNNWNGSICFDLEIGGGFDSTIIELIDAWTSCANGYDSDATDMTTIADMTTAAEATTAEATTSAPTTEAAAATTTEATTTTTKAATTVPALGTCSTVDVCNTFQQSLNATYLIDSIRTYVKTLTTAYQLQWKGWDTKLWNIATSGASMSSVFSQSKTVLVNFTKSSSVLYQGIHNVTIEEWGRTVDYYCGCPTPSS